MPLHTLLDMHIDWLDWRFDFAANPLFICSGSESFAASAL